MRIILQERLPNLGEVGDKIKVKAGYARNYLIPKGKAVKATAENEVIFEKRRAELEKQAAEILAIAKKRAVELEKLVLKLEAHASDEGKLFGSIGPRDVADAIIAAGVEVVKSEVEMPEGPIRHVGEHEVSLSLHGEVHVTVKIVLIAIAEE